MMAFAAVFMTLAQAAYAHGDDGEGGGNAGCAPGLKNRTAAQVLVAHRAALAAGDWLAVGCNYGKNAKVISDQGVTTGRADIVLALQGLSGFFGGTIPMLNQEVIVTILGGNTEMARVLFSITTPCVTIADGVDTYIIKDGRIQAQTAHGFPTFTCAPPMP